MIRIFRRFSFINPHTINSKFSESKSAFEILNLFDEQKIAFEMQDHAVPMLENIKKFSSSEDIGRAMNDKRFNEFLSILNKESSTDTYLNTLYHLSKIYREAKYDMHTSVKLNFIQRTSENYIEFSVSNCCKCLGIIMNSDLKDNDLLNLAQKIVEFSPTALEKSDPTAEDCVIAITSCTHL